MIGTVAEPRMSGQPPAFPRSTTPNEGSTQKLHRLQTVSTGLFTAAQGNDYRRYRCLFPKLDHDS